MAGVLFQQESYKRGVVLGLTMAEIVLIVLFTLLLVLAAVVSKEKREKALLISERDNAKAQLALVEKLASALRSTAIPDPEAFFRELVIAKEAAARAEKTEVELREARAQVAQLTAGKDALAKTNAELTKQNEKMRADLGIGGKDAIPGHQWPPIIRLSEADNYFFKSGSAELSPDFRNAIVDKVVPKIQKIAADYPDVDVIEVVGHTDEQPIRSRYSNLDEAMVDAVKSRDLSTLVPADNAGLGEARAVAVVSMLNQDERLKRFSVLPLSGGQLIKLDEKLTTGSKGDVKERRRIEIRLRKHQSAD
jgi:flagellar motor protein MotB